MLAPPYLLLGKFQLMVLGLHIILNCINLKYMQEDLSEYDNYLKEHVYIYIYFITSQII